MTVIDIGLYAIVTTYTDLAWVRATRILRPAFVICCHRHVRRATRNLRQCLYDLFTLLSFLAAVIVVTALLFFVLFRNRHERGNVYNHVTYFYVQSAGPKVLFEYSEYGVRALRPHDSRQLSPYDVRKIEYDVDFISIM